ncbi:MAG: hypothetical protein ABIQ95_15570 [Bdellovibrionia bacterium]
MKNKESKAPEHKVFKDYHSYRAFYFPIIADKGKGIEAGASILGADLAKSTILELTQKMAPKK